MTCRKLEVFGAARARNDISWSLSLSSWIPWLPDFLYRTLMALFLGKNVSSYMERNWGGWVSEPGLSGKLILESDCDGCRRNVHACSVCMGIFLFRILSFDCGFDNPRFIRDPWGNNCSPCGKGLYLLVTPTPEQLTIIVNLTITIIVKRNNSQALSSKSLWPQWTWTTQCSHCDL